MPHEYVRPASQPAQSGGPSSRWKHRKLYDNVREALFALPGDFESSINLSGIRATDLFALNSLLGASIEDAVTNGLNQLRHVWDPDDEYSVYRFVRQAQVFPDVLLTSDAPEVEAPILGIELKGWFVLSKESEPSFRYTITSEACADADLLAIFPWSLSDVVAGQPRILSPFVCEAKYAAQRRNYHWHNMREEKSENTTILLADHQSCYPKKSDQISDKAAEDGGKNFGRIARSGLLDGFVAGVLSKELSGIPIKAWIKFFKVFSDDKKNLDREIEKIEASLNDFVAQHGTSREGLIEAFERVVATLKS